MNKNKVYVMHYAVADDDEESKDGLVFLSELPDWWQSMSFQYLLFTEELPDEIVMLQEKDGIDSDIVLKRNNNTYQSGDITVRVSPYNKSGYREISPLYVGNLDFPKDVKAHWIVDTDGYQMDRLILQENRFITGFSLFVDED